MPFIQQALADAKEDVPVPEGEYELEIIQATAKQSKKYAESGKAGDNMISVAIAIRSDEYPSAATVFHNIMLVTDPAYEYNHLWLRDQKRFLTLFAIPHEGNGFDVDDFQGATARCLLKVDQNDRGDDINVLALPRVKEEEHEQARGNGRGARKPARRR
jgi:hypothetical protein